MNVKIPFNSRCIGRLAAWIALASLFACQPEKPAEIAAYNDSIPEVVDYNFHVRPILSENCFACHGPDKNDQQAGLRLDVAEAAYSELPESPGMHAITPGDLRNSEAFHRILTDDPDLVMPPPESNLQLTDKEKAILIRWIEQGAEYKDHWAFVKPEKPEIPETETAWGHNEIDAFVLDKLEQKGFEPSAEAEKETLIRRASFDLTGLPPTLEEIDAFLADESENAYEKLVDRLLASPAYGERMTAHWLDVARYADSDGYLDDKHRDFTPWRDWVIKAFNENMSYEDFVTWQLAGDLMLNATQEQILATAFNRLHKRNSEAGIVFEEYRVEYVADRANTLGKAFLALTTECARCHDHKYDPISQKDYYQFFAFFNSTAELGTAIYGPDQTPPPSMMLTDQETDAMLDFLHKNVDSQEDALAEAEKEALQGFEGWKATWQPERDLSQRMQQDLTAYYPLDGAPNGKSPNLANAAKPAKFHQPTFKEGKKGNAYFVGDYGSGYLGDKIGWYRRTEPFSVDFWLYPDTIYKESNVFLHCENLRLGLKGYSLHLKDNHLQFIMAHSWPSNALQVTSKQALPPKKWHHITVTYDGSSKAEGVALYLDGEPLELTIDHDALYKGIQWVDNIHTYGFGGFQIGQRDKFVPIKNSGIDELRIFGRELTGLEVQYQHDAEKTLAEIGNASDAVLQAYYLAHHQPQLTPLRKALQAEWDSLNEVVNEVPEIMVMGDLPEPRPTYILERGAYNAHGEEVQPATPESVLPFPEDLPRNRLGLAKWMFHEDNPLTARVFVNRVWQLHFGNGLVKTSDDFGNQGDLPTHPELLDWLAVDFRESGWDIKKLHKKILMSATYRQRSVITPEMLEKDPENKLLARAPRFRLPAEMIRDNALAISGLLVDRKGGEPAYPYQPEGLWDELSNKHWRYKYLQEPGEGLYRRSIYTVWKRTAPPPSMLIFDAPDRSVCEVKRRPTSTPLQALVLLNDPQYVEAARVTAERILQENPENSVDARETRLAKAFRLVTGRHPEKAEQSLLNGLYHNELERFQSSPEETKAFLGTGERPVAANLDPAQTAALAVVVNAVMNTDEGYVRF